LGDLFFDEKKFKDAKKYYDDIIKITTKNACDWQKVKPTMNDSGFEDEKDFLIIDPYLAHSLIRIAVFNLTNGDLTAGKKSIERGITILKKIYDSLHPGIIYTNLEMSKAYVDQANLLKEFTLQGAKQFFPEINRLFEQAIKIDRDLYGDGYVNFQIKLDYNR
jgi:tetratricopeptide (TPR) repeat protein